jgi:signal transduction histidine kinase
MQIRTRLTLQFTFLVSAILLLSFMAIYFFARWQWNRDFENRLYEKAITAATLLLKVDQVDSALLKVIDRAKRDYLYRENISVLDDRYTEIYTNNDTIDFRLSNLQLAQIQRLKRTVFELKPFSVVGILFVHQQQNYLVVAGAINRDAQQNLQLLRNLLATTFLFWIALVSVAGWVYAGRALKPIQRVMGEVQDITTTSLNKRLGGADKPDEIGKLALIFNQLLERLENAFVLQKSFVANVSHELRNPLTKVTSQLEVTLLNDRPPQEYRETIASVLDDIRELNQLTNTLLDLAKLTQGGGFTMSHVRLDELVLDARQAVVALDTNYEVKVFFDEMPEDTERLNLMGNPHLLKTALINVMENACKFSTGHEAIVRLQATNDGLRVQVENEIAAATISEEERVRIFEPFYRIRGTTQVKGYGIGLSLAQRIMSIHKGSIAFASAENRISVTLAFPAF